MTSDTFTTAEAAALLTERGVTAANGGPVRAETVKKWCERGRLPATKVGDTYRGEWRIKREDIEAFEPGTPGRPRKDRIVKKSQWIGTRGAAFERVGMAFEALGFIRPRPDGGGEIGAYAANIAAQYRADLSEAEAMAVITYGLEHSREQLQYMPDSLEDIVRHYAEDD